LLIAWLAFEHKSYDKREIDPSLLNREVTIDEEMVEITKQDEQKPQPMEMPKQTTQLEIVQDDVEVEDIEINAEVEQNEVIEEYVAPEVVDEEVVEQEIFKIVEEMPSFPGGEAKLMEYVSKNIKYPQIARETGIQGRVFVNFVVEPDGSVSNVTVLRGIGGGCDEEAMRVVKNMPKWKPGKQRGKAVRVQYMLPVNFRLQ
jgi:protein TonB